VKIDLQTPHGIRSGLFGRARFDHGQREAVVVPSAALIHRGQLQGVYIVGEDQVANLRFITLGKHMGDGYEVLAGLEPGERVVQSAGRDVAGRKIEVR
jgi:hypothetical protein